ncbi:hypothetical protein [Vibrio spartinae]|nr:hypothetical protein [Vibrio spartinae]
MSNHYHMVVYIDKRTHESLGNLPPAAYRDKIENSSLELCH